MQTQYEQITLCEITPDAYSDFLPGFQRVVRVVFPLLGFSPAETESFLNANDRLYGDDVVFVVKAEQGLLAYGMRYSGWNVEYLFPTDWPNRYTALTEAIRQLKTAYLQADPESPLLFRIREDAPSHNAFYAALLPTLGFTMEPRIRFTADQNTIDLRELPSLPPGIAEVAFDPGRLAEFMAAHAQAFQVYADYASEESRRRLHTRFMQDGKDAIQQEGCLRTWIGLERQGKIIGSCYGTFANNKMFIEELAVLPEYQGRGVGKYLLLRCMQALRHHYGAEGARFVLDTTRTWDRALRFYYKLGFLRAELYTNATFSKACIHADS